MASDTKALKTQDVWDSCIEGLHGQFRTFFHGRELPVVMVANRTDLRSLVKKQGTIDFPFFSIQLSGIEPNREGYNPFAMRHIGMRGPRISGDQAGNLPQRMIMFKFNPVKIRATIRFLTQDAKDIYEFSKQWIDHCERKTLNFALEMGDAEIHIKVIPDEAVSFPDLEIEELGSLWTLETSIEMHGYSGSIERAITITKYNINGSVVSEPEPNKYVQENVFTVVSNLKLEKESDI